MRKKPTRKRPYFKIESAMTAILRDASGKMHHGILFDPPLILNLSNFSWYKHTLVLLMLVYSFTLLSLCFFNFLVYPCIISSPLFFFCFCTCKFSLIYFCPI